MSVSKNVSDIFYEQMCGSTSGHMAHVPNNPVLFSMMKVFSGSSDNVYAASKTEFAELLRSIAANYD